MDEFSSLTDQYVLTNFLYQQFCQLALIRMLHIELFFLNV